jgi:hypothetical protein
MSFSWKITSKYQKCVLFFQSITTESRQQFTAVDLSRQTAGFACLVRLHQKLLYSVCTGDVTSGTVCLTRNISTVTRICCKIVGKRNRWDILSFRVQVFSSALFHDVTGCWQDVTYYSLREIGFLNGKLVRGL